MQSLERLGPFFPGGRIGFLLVHGLAGTPAEMKILGKRLNRYGFTVLCPQLAGHCASEEELITTCWSDWSRSVEDAFDALSRHMDAVFVGGLSAGAVLSLRHAQRYPGRARGLASIPRPCGTTAGPSQAELPSAAHPQDALFRQALPF
ncbi:MAG: alpha/beta hydrolase [Bilophila wadsworthia]